MWITRVRNPRGEVVVEEQTVRRPDAWTPVLATAAELNREPIDEAYTRADKFEAAVQVLEFNGWNLEQTKMKTGTK